MLLSDEEGKNLHYSISQTPNIKVPSSLLIHRMPANNYIVMISTVLQFTVSPIVAFSLQKIPTHTGRSQTITLEIACCLLGVIGTFTALILYRFIRHWRHAGERERERAQEAERRYQSLFENAVEGIFQTSAEGSYLAVNPALAKIYGYDSPNDLMTSLTDIGRQLYVKSETRAEFKRLMEENDIVSGFEAEIYCKDRTTVWIREHARAVRDTDGEILYYEGTVENITSRKRAEAKITTMNTTLELRLKRIAALRNIDLAISSSLDPLLSMNVVLDQTVEQLGVDAAAIWLYGTHDHSLKFYAGKGHDSQHDYVEVRVGYGMLGEAALQMLPLRQQLLTDQNRIASHTTLMMRKGFVGYAGTPLIAKGQLRGWLEVYSRQELPGDTEWAEYMDTLAGQAAIALDSTTMFRELQRNALDLSIAYDSTIEGWAKALGLRDQETAGHSERVTDLTTKVARAMGISEANMVHVRRGALLHDIGKMAVPDAILLKPGPLNDEEREVMSKHPVCAYDMLSHIHYLRQALEIPYCHHEKWDGTGYPRGLKGEEIPLGARIFAIVDVWDALTSDRPYRKAWPRKKTLDHIHSLAGTHFDPQVVEVFTSVMADEGHFDLPMAA